MTLIDTSVWIDHLRAPDPSLSRVLLAGRATTHDFVIGELACGTIRDRANILEQVQSLTRLPNVPHADVMQFVDRHKLHGRGLSWVDFHLLASCLVSGTTLLTRDAALAAAAGRVGVPTA
ncbi:MAG: type II toxin-antitoxin system VapC family toxin [Phycisphaerales bacterium]